MYDKIAAWLTAVLPCSKMLQKVTTGSYGDETNTRGSISGWGEAIAAWNDYTNVTRSNISSTASAHVLQRLLLTMMGI